MKVLLVDDEPVILELLGFAFGKKNIPFATAPTAEAGLELARAERFEAALIDKNLPGMSGLDLLAKIRERDSQIALLMMTGYASPETAAQALNLDVDAYLEKPFPNMAAVVDRVLAAIEKRNDARAARLRLATPSPEMPAPPARVLLVTSAELESAVRSALLSQDVVTVARKETELNAAVSTVQDLVVIDAFLLGGEVVPVVERAQRTSKETEFVVVSDRALDLRTVQKRALEQIRRKKLAS
jgi:DNA-binding response OmpR family regulator